MPGPGPRGVPTAVPNSKGPGTAKSFLSVRPFGQNAVDPAVVSADIGSLALTGFAPIVLTPRTVHPGVGALALTGLAPAILTPRVAKPGVGSLTVAGLAPTLVLPRVVRPAVGALTVTGLAPTVLVPRVVRPGVGAVVVSGLAPVVQTPQVVRPGVGVLAVAGFAATATTTVGAKPGVGALSLTGFAPTVSVGGNALVRPGVGSLAVDGFAPVVMGDPVTTIPAGGWMQPIRRAKQQAVWVVAETFAPVVIVTTDVPEQFHAVPVKRPAVAVADVGSLELTGFAPVVAVSQVIAPQPEHEPDATGEPRAGDGEGAVASNSERPFLYVTSGLPSGIESPAPFISVGDASSLRSPAVSLPLPSGEDSGTPAWLASPIVVDVGYATLLLDGLAPTIHVTTRTIPTDDPWSPESEDDAAILWAAYDLLVNA